MKDGPLSLTSLDVQNILRLKAVRLTLDPGGALVIEGKNEQGKSSVIKALEMLLAGGKETPDAPLHGDETKGHIIATFGEIVVKKVFRKGKRPQLTITTAEGARMQAPQTMLDKLLTHVSLDPVSFMNKTDREKTVILSDLMGFDSKEFDDEVRRIFDCRTDANREAKRLQAVAEATTFHEDAPDEEVSVGDLMTELKKRQAHNATIREKQTEMQEAEKAVIDHIDKLAAAEGEVSDIEGDIKQLKDQMLSLQNHIDDVHKDITQVIKARVAAQDRALSITTEYDAMVIANEDEVTTQIASADETNRQVRGNVARENARVEYKAAQEKSDSLNEHLEVAKSEREKARLEARDRLPIPDLDISENAVLFKGKPLSQAGSSAELRVSVAVAIALNKDKRVKLLLIDDAEKLDADNVKVVMEMAREAGFQVIMCRVGDGAKASVVIEDGEIKND